MRVQKKTKHLPIDSIGHSQYSAVCSIKGSYGPQNPQVSIVLKASKYAGAKDLQVSAPAAHVLMHFLN